jgi:ABC-type transport system substrate-binding protein
VHYGDPFGDVEVTAQDFIRALERTANPKANTGGYPFYYSVIEGFDDFSSGDADSISGLSAPDESTLVIKITQPVADISYRFGLPATAPIPPNGDARMGAAEGHDKDYGRFLVSTGPYQFEGAEAMDFSVPAKDQSPAAGYVPGRQIVMVRNPNWDPATDELMRAAKELGTLGIHPGLTVANMVIPPEQVTTPFVKSRRDMQEKYLEEIVDRFSVPLLQIPLLPNEIKGLRMLTQLGEQVYGKEKVMA